MNVGIVGASGFAGLELLKLLLQGHDVEVKALNSQRFAGKKVSSLDQTFPSKGLRFTGYSIEQLIDLDLDLVFLCLPHGEAAKLAPKFGCKVIDLSADHRGVKEAGEKRVAYGLPELFADEIRRADLVANPGCYATACILSALPLTSKGWLKRTVFDCLSGYSGAGREKTSAPEFKARVKDNAWAYDLTGHRQVPEIQAVLGNRFSFTPHVVPLFRGLLCTQHAALKQPKAGRDVLKAYEAFYKGKPFVQVWGKGCPDLASAQGKPFFAVGGFEGKENGELVTVGSLDNLLKGAASQAVQNMNLLLGFPEGKGLVE
ncbi:MAG: N-acetyl-gamma-glutamyl-phosphate reductase [Candidatus Diapherotrites archaeon]|uniref:N-acetyl-gamma-glutamyl-phosphate reductase n=1 Tax=Candidatus Iainarchaeum sp. TaxID=3101447 RepID=A0A8T4L6Q4_9ARCH|nr:N-acetyl-gamma-glutamyl-phosphate reductase [Candidatus Diapherotrites archaeon]